MSRLSVPPKEVGRRALFAAGLAVLAASMSCRTQSRPENFILITLDTQRADYISAYEPGKAVTPSIDRLARDAVLFEQAVSPEPLTRPSVSTIFTGQFSDPDAGSSFGGIAVVGNTANPATEGSWHYSTNGGTNWYAIGSVADGASALSFVYSVSPMRTRCLAPSAR